MKKTPRKISHDHRYVFVFGGVMSGVGKGIATASLGLLFQARGYKVRPIKIDPYLNVDAGTMNPTEHGEVFVLDSGLETDQDMGNYERFLNRDLSSEDYMTSGMVYKHVIDKERNLGFNGKTVEAIPHIRDEIMSRIEYHPENRASNGFDITLVEVGGTVGDYQNSLFIEAARVMRLKYPRNVQFVLVSYLPVPGSIGEMKTRPTQHAVRQLNSYGIQPDVVIARAAIPLDDRRKEKIAVSSNVPVEAVISAPDIKSIYDVPANFEKDGLAELLIDNLGLKRKPKERTTGLQPWKTFVRNLSHPKKDLNIGVIGKYFDTGDFVLSDSYVSVIEAVRFSAAALGVRANLIWINSKRFETGEMKPEELSRFDGIVVPGGFGKSGIEGKIIAIKYARENKIPYLGLCYGMQLMVIEYARHVAGMKDANTTEIDPKSPFPVIDILPEQKINLEQKRYGGSMRLGAFEAKIIEGTQAHHAYKKDTVLERHRHRYEVNPEFIAQIEAAGLVFSGKSPNGVLMEVAELPKKVHPFFVGSQFHPEFKARPLSPHPLFSAFLKAALEGKK
ncbi:MAG TPA: CTP synthase [Candidatus Paceibacterota bacterium]|nr:CTP synthase [Candidatus Paceibacterota bacterium]